MSNILTKCLSRRALLGASAGMAVLTGLVGCGGNAGTDASNAKDAGNSPGPTEGGGDITVGSAYATQNYHPSSTSSALALSANLNVMEGLYEISFHDYSTRPALAAEDPKKVDDTTFEVALRTDAKFSNGNSVTAADVVSSFGRATAEGGIYAPMLAPISAVEAKDNMTVTVKTAVPNFSLLQERLAIIKVVPTDATDDELTAKPVGTGPWMYDVIFDDAVTLAPNPYYNGDHPAKDNSIRYDVLKDATARVTYAQEGSTLVCESVPAESIDQLKNAGMSIDSVQGFGTRFVMFNVAKAPWDNVKVRQAVMYALSYDKMISNALSGMASAPKCYLPETFPNYHEASVVYGHDVEKAKQLLSEAGITPGAITVRTTDNDQVVAMSAQIKNDLDELGFATELRKDTSAATYAAIDGGEAYDILLAPGDPSCFGADPDLLLSWWFGNNVWMKTRCPWNGSDEWKELQSLMGQALEAQGSAQQLMWNRCFDILAENVVLYPVLQVKTTTASWRDNANKDGVKVSGNFLGIGTTGVALTDVATVR